VNPSVVALLFALRATLQLVLDGDAKGEPLNRNVVALAIQSIDNELEGTV